MGTSSQADSTGMEMCMEKLSNTREVEIPVQVLAAESSSASPPGCSSSWLFS